LFVVPIPPSRCRPCIEPGHGASSRHPRSHAPGGEDPVSAARNLRALGAVAISLCLATTAYAGDPAPSDRQPGRDSKLPTLDQTYGVDLTSSQPGTGLAGMTG